MTNNVKFLLVDDLEENLVALEALLAREGLELHLARSGEDALELMLANDYALALLDVQMPGMDGFELAEIMRANERSRHIPIIFVTAGSGDAARRFRGYEAGAVDFIQQKTNRPVQFELTADVRATLIAWLERRGGSAHDYLFPSRVDLHGHMSTRQYARLVDEWVTAIGLRKAEYGTHSLRRTKAAMIYRATGNIRAIQILLGHTKIENTVRYLGVDLEDALLLAERTEI